jgi:hypothetical protein
MYIHTAVEGVQRILRKSITFQQGVCNHPFRNAILFQLSDRFNATLAPPRVQLMATGVHTMQEITCSNCASYLGWKIVAAHDSSEKWKEGGCLLELESLSNGDAG